MPTSTRLVRISRSDLAIRTRDGSVLEGREGAWKKVEIRYKGCKRKDRYEKLKEEGGREVVASARLVAQSFIRRGAPLREITPGKSPEARIAAFLRRLLSAGDILSAITSI